MYRDLKARGERVWMEPKLARGKKREPYIPRAVQEMLGEIGGSLLDAIDEVQEESGTADDAEEGAMRGDVEEDEEYIMGGEAYD